MMVCLCRPPKKAQVCTVGTLWFAHEIMILCTFLPTIAGSEFSFSDAFAFDLALPAGEFAAVDSFLAFFSRAVDFAINSRAARSLDGEAGGDLPIANKQNREAPKAVSMQASENSSSAAFQTV